MADSEGGAGEAHGRLRATWMDCFRNPKAEAPQETRRARWTTAVQRLPLDSAPTQLQRSAGPGGQPRRGGNRRRPWGPGQEPHAPPLRGAGCPMTSLELEGVPGPCSPPLGLPQRRRPSASAPWLSPAFLGALKIHHFLKEPCVDSGARTRLWESLQSVNSSSVSGSRPRPGS